MTNFSLLRSAYWEKVFGEELVEVEEKGEKNLQKKNSGSQFARLKEDSLEAIPAYAEANGSKLKLRGR